MCLGEQGLKLISRAANVGLCSRIFIKEALSLVFSS